MLIEFDKVLSIFWGFRVKPGQYSQPMADCFYNEVAKNGPVNPIKVFEIVKKAIETEIQFFKGNQFTSSLVTIDSFKKAIEKSFS